MSLKELISSAIDPHVDRIIKGGKEKSTIKTNAVIVHNPKKKRRSISKSHNIYEYETHIELEFLAWEKSDLEKELEELMVNCGYEIECNSKIRSKFKDYEFGDEEINISDESGNRFGSLSIEFVGYHDEEIIKKPNFVYYGGMVYGD